MRLDVLGDWPQLLAVFSGIAAVFGLVRDLIAHRRDGERSLRPVVGWFLAMLGFLMAVAAVGSLITHSWSPMSRDWIVAGAIAAGSVTLSSLGAVIAARTPVADWATLSAIAASVRGRVDRHDAEVSRKVPTVELRVVKRSSGRGPIRVTALLRRPPGKLIIICGPAGSGKTVTLQAIVARICDRAVPSRRPRRLALYVDLNTMTVPSGPIDESTIKAHLKASASESANRLAPYLEQPRRRPRWLLVFDLGDHLSATQAEQYVRAVRNFVADREDCAVVATQFDLSEPSAFSMAPLEAPEQRMLLRAFNIRPRTHHAVLYRLRHDPQLDDIAGSPLLLTRLGKCLVTEELIGNRHEIIDTITSACLGPRGLPEATQLAYRMTANPSAHVPVDATVDELVDVGLGRVTHVGFRFNHPMVQSYLAGQYLRGLDDTANLAGMLEQDDWHPALIAALQSGPCAFREQVVAVVAERIASVTTAMPNLVSDAGVLSDDGNVGLPMPGSFTWPPAVLRQLTLLCDGFAYDPPGDRTSAVVTGVDQLILTAVAAGAGIDREYGLELLPLASRDVAAALAEYVLTGRKVGALAIWMVPTLAVRPDVYEVMSEVSQANAVDAAFRFRLFSQVLYTWVSGEHSRRTLQARVRLVLRVAQLAVIAVIVLMLVLALRATDPLITVVAGVVTSASVVFLVDSGAPRQLGLTRFGYVSARCLRSVIVLMIFVGFLTGIAVIVQILTLRIGEALGGIVLLWLCTWPAAMLLSAAAIPNEPGLRLFPQFTLYRSSAVQAVAKPAANLIQRARSSRTRLAALLISGALILLIAADLPLNDQAEGNVDSALAMAMVVAAAIAFRSDSPRTSRSTRASASGQMSTAAEPLDVFRERDSYDIAAGLQRLTAASPDMIREVEPILANLNSVLEFIKEMLPSQMDQPIKPRLWSWMEKSMPEQVPGLYAMVKEYDKKNPGRLVARANSLKAQKTLRDLRARAQSSVTSP